MIFGKEKYIKSWKIVSLPRKILYFYQSWNLCTVYCWKNVNLWNLVELPVEIIFLYSPPLILGFRPSKRHAALIASCD